MKPNPIHRLPAPLEGAVQRLKLAAREACERAIESLGLAALAATHAFQRDGLLAAQFELNRKSALFVLTYNDAFDDRVLRELGPRLAPAAAPAPAPAAVSNWDALSLVDDRELEQQISAERFAMEIAISCEWELRELDAYVGALLTDAGGEPERNPLRPDIIGHALIRGIDAVSDSADVRKVLASELGRSLAPLLRTAYSGIVAEWRDAGVRPLGLALRVKGSRGDGAGAADARDDDGDPSRSARGSLDSRYGRSSGAGAAGSRHADAAFAASARPSIPGSMSGVATGHGSASGASFGRVDPSLMQLLRRLAQSGPVDTGGGRAVPMPGWADPGSSPAPLTNVIRAHRDELRQASSGSVDHMVIDVIGFLFDQILADPKVPPQMARQIARLQLPVLRAALGDPAFFASHRHPVRRFVNRIASLGASFDDWNDADARNFLAKVKSLVHDVVQGDFDRIDLYERQLSALEAFVAEQAAREARSAGDAPALLDEKEDQWRLRQLYAQRLEGELKDVPAPAFLRDFVARVWSQVLLRAAELDGGAGERSERLKRAGRELFLSVHAKATPAQRKVFLAELPKLMHDLIEGMNLIGWPETSRRSFFGQLMPAHAEALKSSAARPLDANLMARQVETVLERAPPTRDEVRAAGELPVLVDEIAPPALTDAEAQRVGLVDENAVDWSAAVDIDLSEPADAAEPAAAAAELPELPGLPSAAEPAPEAATGASLAEHVQIGYAYRMHVDGVWRKVRLVHVSAGRGFFLFTHGARHAQTVSLTRRMLERLCETGRFRAFEQATLLERATLRARRQLAALGSHSAPRGARA